MGTRINVIFDHDLSNWCDRNAAVERLNEALPAARQVDDYWHQVDPGDRRGNPVWSIEPQPSRCPWYQMYDGPGALFVGINPKAARIRTGGRWRGFLRIEPLRRVHLIAFHAIAQALGGREMILFSDNDSVDEVFWSGHNYAECLNRLTETEGKPQPTIEMIDAKIVRECEFGVPAIWFREKVVIDK